MSRLEEILAGGARLKLHINYGDGFGYVYACIAEPRITLAYGGPKTKKSKRVGYRKFLVAGCDTEFATLDEAVLEVERQDRKKTDEAAWDAAAPPRKKPAAIPGVLQDE